MNSLMNCCMIIAMPMLVYALFVLLKKSTIIHTKRLGIASSACIGVVCCLFWKLSGRGLPEVLYLSAFLTVFVLFAAAGYQNRQQMLSLALECFCWLGVITIAYSILTYGQTIIDSDYATATMLGQSILKSGNLFPESWNYANGDIWVIGMQLITLIPMAFIKDYSLARMVGSLIWVAVGIASVICLSRKTFKSACWVILVPLLFLFTFGQSDMILYSAAYTGTIIWMCVCSVLLCSIADCVEEGKKPVGWLLLYAVVMILLTAGGKRRIATQVLPSLAAVIICIYYDTVESQSLNIKKILGKTAFYSAVIVVPAIIGSCIYLWLSGTHAVNHTVNSQTVFVLTLDECWANLEKSVMTVLGCFGFHGGVELFSVQGFQNLISIILCLLLCVIVPFMQYKRIGDEPRSVRYFLLYTAVHVSEMLILYVFLGKNEYQRYLLSSVVALTVVSGRYIYEYWIRASELRKTAWTTLFGLAILIEILGMVSLSAGWRGKLVAEKDYCRQIESFGASKGYATYWNAYNNTIFSDGKLEMGAVIIRKNRILPYRWLVDNKVFDEKADKTFLLVTEEENENVKEQLGKQLPDPIETHMVNNSFVYLFDCDIVAYFYLTEGIVTPDELSVLEGGGVISKDSITLFPDGLQYGPYVDMLPGKYAVTYHGRQLGGIRNSITAEQGTIGLNFQTKMQSEDKIVIELKLDSRMKEVEFVSHNESESPAGIDYITVYRIE